MFEAYKNAIYNHHRNKSYNAGCYPRGLDSVLSRQACDRAYSVISSWDGYQATPLFHLKGLAGKVGVADILYKHEGPRFGLGSFKALGGAYSVLQLLAGEVGRRLAREVGVQEIQNGQHKDIIKDITIVTATDGNHGRSVAWGCQKFGANCSIYVHAGVSQGRAKAVEDLGAKVVWVEGNYDASVHKAADDAANNGWFVVSDTSYEGYVEPPRNVMAGYSVMTAEICRQIEGQDLPTLVFVQGGVGGLAAVVCIHLWQHFGETRPRLIIVEPDRADCLYQSGVRGETVDVDIVEETIMAGLSCGEVSPLGWLILSTGASDFMTISDDMIAPTMKLLAKGIEEDQPFAAGESGVAGLAGVLVALGDETLKNAVGLDANSRILVFGTEGATDPEIYRQLTGISPDTLGA